MLPVLVWAEHFFVGKDVVKVSLHQGPGAMDWEIEDMKDGRYGITCWMQVGLCFLPSLNKIMRTIC